MMPAKRIRITNINNISTTEDTEDTEDQTCSANKIEPPCPLCPLWWRALTSPLRRLDQFIHALRLVQRFSHRQPRTHPSVERARLEQLLVAALSGDAPAIEHENAIGVADRRQPVRDHDRRSAR